jgi:Family of unknown function (DUF6448)
MKAKVTAVALALLALLSAGLFWPQGAAAHCDTMDGPVVKSAQEALATDNLDPVLAWVADKDVAAVRAAFEKARTVRVLGPEAKEMADTYFFETVVRVHRASEGEPYTGLKPAGTDLGPVVPQADLALEKGAVDDLSAQVAGKVQEGIRARFNDVVSKKDYAPNDVQAGREYVEAYVQYMHYVEEVYDLAVHPAADHHAEGAAPAEQVSAHQEPAAGHAAMTSAPDAHSATVATDHASAPDGHSAAAATDHASAPVAHQPAGLPQTGGNGATAGSPWAIWALAGLGLAGLGLGLRVARGRRAR